MFLFVWHKKFNRLSVCVSIFLCACVCVCVCSCVQSLLTSELHLSVCVCVCACMCVCEGGGSRESGTRILERNQRAEEIRKLNATSETRGDLKPFPLSHSLIFSQNKLQSQCHL